VDYGQQKNCSEIAINIKLNSSAEERRDKAKNRMLYNYREICNFFSHNFIIF
jgi:hypothetical protein